MGNAWFETVAVAQKRAQRRLPKSVYQAIWAGSERGVTLADNVAAFGEIGFAPRVAGLADKRDMATTVMGQDIPFPVVLSPTGVQAVHPDGEVAIAKGAAARGAMMGLSCFASKPIEEVIAHNTKVLFQTYWMGTREQIEARLERARTAGAVGLILTLDWSFAHGRDWGSPHIPDRVGISTIVRHLPEAVRRPRWMLQYAKTLRPPALTVPNVVVGDQPAPNFFGAYGEWMSTPPPSWDDLRWLREQWSGPVMLKGVMRVDDAKRAVDCGFTAISVSNHGGNNLDGTPATVRALPAIAEAVGSQVEVLIDGGVRRGGDVVKALAFGARAVMIGRPYLWGLAAAGQAGVENVLDVMRNGIDSTLLALGHASIDEVSVDDLVVPEGFSRPLG